MPRLIESLYRLRMREIPKAGAVLADAFKNDPIWTRVFEDEINDDRKMGAWYEGSIRYCLTYGDVYSTSELLEGIAAWVPGDFADMTSWRLIRSAAILSGLKMGMKMALRARKMAVVFEPLEADRRARMQGSPYTYLMIIGVASQYQGQGHGGRLLGALIEESERSGIPVYLETETERNVGMYERLGFRVQSIITLPVLDVPVWEMTREPTA